MGSEVPRTYETFLASSHAQQLDAVYLSVVAALKELSIYANNNKIGSEHVPDVILSDAYTGAQTLKELYAPEEKREFRFLYTFTKYELVWSKFILPVYTWAVRCSWPLSNHEAGVQSDRRDWLFGIRGILENLLILSLGMLSHWSADDNALETRSPVLMSISKLGTLGSLSRDLEYLRIHLVETAVHPHPIVRIPEITRALLLSVRLAHAAMALSASQLQSVLFPNLTLYHALVDSGIVEHACALRLQLVQRQWQCNFADVDICLFGLLRKASQILPWTWLAGTPAYSQQAVQVSLPRAGQHHPPTWPSVERKACDQIWGILTHHTVQTYLGWWLMGSTVVLKPAAPDGNLPYNLSIACRTAWQQLPEDLELRALQWPLSTAAACWLCAIHSQQLTVARPTPRAHVSAHARTHALMSAMTSTGTAQRNRTPQRSASSGLSADVQMAEAPEAAAPEPETGPPPPSPTGPAPPTHAHHHHHHNPDDPWANELPYTAANVYDMLLPVAEHCVEYVMSGARGSAFATSLEMAASTLAASLQPLPPAQALKRLSGCWQLFTKILTLDFGVVRASVLQALAQPAGRLLFLSHLSGESASASALASSRPSEGASASAPIGIVVPPLPLKALAAARFASGARASSSYGDGEGCSSGRSSAHHSWVAASKTNAVTRPQTAASLSNRQTAHHNHLSSRQRQLPVLSPNSAASYSLRCALSSGFIPALERALRHIFNDSSTPANAATVTNVPTAAPAHSASSDIGSSSLSTRQHSNLAAASVALDLSLRRPGSWPAMLAHGSPTQVGALILSLRKVLLATDPDARPPGVGYAASSAWVTATDSDAEEYFADVDPTDPRVLWRLQLLALIEQTEPLLLSAESVPAAAVGVATPVNASGGAASGYVSSNGDVSASGSTNGGTSPSENIGNANGNANGNTKRVSSSSSLSSPAVAISPTPPSRLALSPPLSNQTTPRTVPQLGSLDLNHGLCLGDSPCGHLSTIPTSASVDLDSDGVHFQDLQEPSQPAANMLPPLLELSPNWDQILAAGACPTKGFLGHGQFERMAVLAATEWLPLVLTRRQANGRQQPASLASLAPHAAYRVAWRWMLVLARQTLAAQGSAAQTQWLLALRRVMAVDQIAVVLRVACGGSEDLAAMGEKARSTSMAVAVAADALPLALDVLEVLVAAAPQAVAAALADNRKARRAATVAVELSASGAGKPFFSAATSTSVQETPRRATKPYGWHNVTDVNRPLSSTSSNRIRTNAMILASAPASGALRSDAACGAIRFPPAWGPGLALDAHVVRMLQQHNRLSLARCLGDLARVSPREDCFSFQPQVLGERVLGLPPGWSPLPDPGNAIRELGFKICAHEDCAALEGSTEATLMFRATGGGGLRAVSYCSVACEIADRAAKARGEMGRGKG